MSFLYTLKHLFMPKTKERFVSDIDLYLAKFNKEHPEKSASQLAEIKKFQRVAKLRDDKNASEETDKLWEKF